MAIKKKTPAKPSVNLDLKSWNFIIFLTLAFMLLVFVVTAMQGVAQDVRTKAGLACPKVEIPDPTECTGKWVLDRDGLGCTTFRCESL